MTKTPPSASTAVRLSELGSMESIKEQHPQWTSSESDDVVASPPASVLALAAAATAASQRAAGRRSATSSHQIHRRSQTIVAAGDLEMELLQKHKAVEDLHTELESKNKALEESQEEAQLAARIGQTLLQRNQEMGAEIQSKAIELQNRAENAEAEVRVLERKLSMAVTQIRSLDMARTRATLEAEQLTQELDDSRTSVVSLRNELIRTNNELQRIEMTKKRAEEELEASRALVVTMQAAQHKLQAELDLRNDRIEVLASTDRYNVEHISRLEIENQTICQRQHGLQRREQQLAFENESLASKMSAQAIVLKEFQARSHELEHAVVGLHNEMEELREALHAEQTRVIQLTRVNHELDTRLDRQRRAHDDENSPQTVGEDELATQRLQNGSLFYELSRQLRAELQEAKTQRKKDASPEEPAIETEADSPADPSSTRTSRNPSNNTDSVNDGEDAGEPEAPVQSHVVTRVPSLQLERRRSQQGDASVTAAKSPLLRGNDNDDNDDSFVKEFFLLTAAAVKIAGGGLRNDACNIHNEDLYAEAIREGVTFDQFHKWLERRLESDLEISLSPVKTVVAPPPAPRKSQRTTVPMPTMPPLTPARRIISFWSR